MKENRNGGSRLKNRYFEFLCNIVGRIDRYNKLLEELYLVEFYPLIPHDDNRGEDGKQLREKFMDEEGQQALSQSDLGPCSLLEMLIGLSFRLVFETEQSRWEKNPREWFWILIDNLGLQWCDDLMFERLECREELDIKVKNFLDRQYKSDGEGGLFPLKNPKKDQRRVEIWYQMSAYILENYPI
jgi:hypothetical protein